MLNKKLVIFILLIISVVGIYFFILTTTKPQREVIAKNRQNKNSKEIKKSIDKNIQNEHIVKEQNTSIVSKTNSKLKQQTLKPIGENKNTIDEEEKFVPEESFKYLLEQHNKEGLSIEEKKDNSSEEVRLIEYLRENDDKYFYDAIVNILNNENESIENKKYAFNLLKGIATYKSTKLLLDSLANLDDELIEYLHSTFSELGESSKYAMTSEKILPLIEQGIEKYQYDDRITTSLIDAIVKMDNQDALESVIKRLSNDDTSDNISEHLNSSNDFFENHKLVSALSKNITNNNSKVQNYSLMSLAKIGTEEAIDSIINWYSSIDERKEITENEEKIFSYLLKTNPHKKDYIKKTIEMTDFKNEEIKNYLLENLYIINRD